MKIDKNQKGFGVVEILLVIVVIGLIVAVGWLFFDRQQSKTNDNATTSNSSKTSTTSTKETDTTSTESTKTTIYPNTETDTGASSTSKDLSFTAELPTGWSAQSTFESSDIVKTVGNDKYLISSFIEHNGGPNADRNLMEQRVAEGIKTIATVKTSKGTSVSVLQTPTELFLASCVPTGENCYLSLNGKDLYIHLYQVIPHAQSASDIDYSSASAQEVVKDFEAIAKSLSI